MTSEQRRKQRGGRSEDQDANMGESAMGTREAGEMWWGTDQAGGVQSSRGQMWQRVRSNVNVLKRFKCANEMVNF